MPRQAKTKTQPKQLTITYSSSAIGRHGSQRRTLEALGLRKLHQTVNLPDNPSVRGMISKIRHLVTWSEAEEI
jgi:large subunit ribosomal protein L30